MTKRRDHYKGTKLYFFYFKFSFLAVKIDVNLEWLKDSLDLLKYHIYTLSRNFKYHLTSFSLYFFVILSALRTNFLIRQRTTLLSESIYIMNNWFSFGKMLLVMYSTKCVPFAPWLFYTNNSLHSLIFRNTYFVQRYILV